MPECLCCGRTLPSSEMWRKRDGSGFVCKERRRSELGPRSRCVAIEQQLRAEQRQARRAQRAAAA